MAVYRKVVFPVEIAEPQNGLRRKVTAVQVLEASVLIFILISCGAIAGLGEDLYRISAARLSGRSCS